MTEPNRNPEALKQTVDMRWKDLYRIGAISSMIVVVLVVLAIVAFFIWPYAPEVISIEMIFATLQTDLLGGLFSLDPLLLVIDLINILPLLALYVALKPVNESYALIALVLGLIAITLIVMARPLLELAYLSEQIASVTSETAKIQYLAAGETLISMFNGTAWMVSTIFVAISGLISSLLMLRSNIFSKITAYVGIIAVVPQFGFFIPGLGPLLLLVATFGGVIWYILITRTFYNIGWGVAE
jgi:hypothetical protein